MEQDITHTPTSHPLPQIVNLAHLEYFALMLQQTTNSKPALQDSIANLDLLQTLVLELVQQEIIVQLDHLK